MKKLNVSILCVLACALAGPSSGLSVTRDHLILKAASPQAANSVKAPEAGSPGSPSAPVLKGEKEKLSYALGMRMALELKNLRKTVDVDPNLIAQGLKDSLSGSKTLLTNDERIAILTQLQRDLLAKEQQIKQQMAESNLNHGEAFMAANKAKTGVVTLPSGLQYKILTQGTGPKPAVTDTVVCNYIGTNLSGKEFDNSYKRGKPLTTPLTGVIQGWIEALRLMPVGSKWQLFVPPSLAYGERGHGTDIEPNATLIFEVELVSIKPKDDTASK